MRLWRRRADDVDEEIRTHLAMAMEDRIARGESPEEAQRAAVREFGNPLLVRETTRKMWGWEWLEHIGQDLRYGWRRTLRSPAFSLTVIATLAIGVGATAAMFTIVNRVLLQRLPYSDANQLVLVQESGRKGDQLYVRWPDIREWRQRSRTLKEIAFFRRGNARTFLENDNGAQQVDQELVSPNLFHVLGASPAIGHGFDAFDSSGSSNSGSQDTVVLSDAVWRNSFGANSAILGKAISINGERYTVVGVMPPGFGLPLSSTTPQVWSPIALRDIDQTRTSWSPFYSVIARLAPGAKLKDATAEMKAIQAEVAKLYTDPYERELVTSVNVQDYGGSLVQPEVKRALLALSAAALLLWFIACFNVTGLLLARATSRQREIAVRGALGASRMRILQQLLLEGLMLSAGGSLLGLGLAAILLRAFGHGLKTQLKVADVQPDGALVVALLALTIGSALIGTLWPAIAGAHASIEPALRQGGGAQAGHSRAQHRTRSFLVITQIAMSLTLLVCCGLLLRTIYALRHVALGFRTDNIIVGNMAIPSYRFAGQDLNTALYAPLLEKVKSLPGVEGATLMTEVPLGHTFRIMFSFGADGNSADAVKRRDLHANLRVVGGETQKIFGFKMLRGRYFNENDTAGSQPVLVVNRAFVKAYSKSNDPDKIMGQRIVNMEKGKPAVIVGILDDTRQESIADQSTPEIVVCLPQVTSASIFYNPTSVAMDIAVRTSRSPASLVPELRSLMAGASPELANTTFTTMTQIVEDSYGSQALVARLLIVFGTSSLLLCLSGLYGLLAQLVTQRIREIGVRMALGASRGKVIWLVLRQATHMLTAGALAGLALAWFASRFIASFLYGVAPHDAFSMVAVPALLIGSGLAAASFPAARAASIDPVEALRAE